MKHAIQNLILASSLTSLLLLSPVCDAQEEQTAWRKATASGEIMFRKGENLESITERLSAMTGIRVSLIAPLDTLLPQEIIIDKSQKELGSIVDKIIQAIPQSQVIAGSHDIVIVVPIEPSIQKLLDAKVKDVVFDGSISTFLLKCPGVANCGLNFVDFHPASTIHVSLKGEVNVSQILLSAAESIHDRFVVKVPLKPSTIKIGDVEHLIMFPSIQFIPVNEPK